MSAHSVSRWTFFLPDGPLTLTETELANEFMRLWKDEQQRLREKPSGAPMADRPDVDALTQADILRLRREAIASLIAVKPHLDVPYTDDARWTPWTRFAERALRDVDRLGTAALAANDALAAEREARQRAEEGKTMSPEDLFDLVREYRKAPANTASTMTPAEWAYAWQLEWQRANRAEAEVERLREALRRIEFFPYAAESNGESDLLAIREIAHEALAEGGS